MALHAQGRPEKLALVDLASGRRWTYAALGRTIDQAAAAFATLGLAAGDRVAALAKELGRPSWSRSRRRCGSGRSSCR